MKTIRWLNTGLALFAAAMTVSGGVLLETDFAGAAGPLSGRDGWMSRDKAVQLDGKGLVGNGSPDGYVKRELAVPAQPERIRLTARVKFSALPDSAMRNHHLVGKEQPA
ncbi:MAG: hypothetical protein NTZ16_08600, partial [Verrucomicrobia bacterium]|nr:hypothetical protein [Verrucomicrobiota bacterium]